MAKKGDLYWTIYTTFVDPPYIKREKKPCTICKVTATALSSGLLAFSAYNMPQAVKSKSLLKQAAFGAGIVFWAGAMVYSLSMLVSDLKARPITAEPEKVASVE